MLPEVVPVTVWPQVTDPVTIEFVGHVTANVYTPDARENPSITIQ